MSRSLAWATLRHRPGRAVALGSGILLATTAFATLTGAASTSQLQVTGTARTNFRGVYDVLVRPRGTTTGLERSAGLVRANYLSGIFGGITTAQWRKIEALPGVEVAAPIAMIGYDAPVANVPVVLTRDLTSAPRQLLRVNETWTSDNGLTSIPDAPAFAYVTHSPLTSPSSFTDTQVITEDGPQGPGVCSFPIQNRDPAATAYSLSSRTDLECWSTTNGFLGRGLAADEALAAGQVGVNVAWAFPLLIAAVDPVAEGRLDGLDKTVTTGRYLRPSDRGTVDPDYHTEVVPVLAASTTAEQETLTATVQRLPDSVAAAAVGHPLNQDRMAAELAHTSAVTVSTITVTAAQAYRLFLQQLAGPRGRSGLSIYWPTGATTYRAGPHGGLTVAAAPAPADPVWVSAYQGGYARTPIDSTDRAFRPLTSVQFNDQTVAPQLNVVGTFDANRLHAAESGFTTLNNADLETFDNPHLAPADARSRALLKGADLEPNGNLAGYSQQPPQLLTTLGGLATLERYFPASTAAAPISVIRVRVAGVVSGDPASRERVRLVAQRIKQTTGLDVDITAGSSSAPQTVTLPAGRYGRPVLTLTEPWAKKGAVLAIVTAVDRKSLLLFGLVLAVCALFIANGASAAVRARRHELGVLAALGWTPRRLAGTVLAELLTLGVFAGAVGALIAFPLARILHVHISYAHAGLAVPAAVALALTAGAVPALRAGRMTPVDALRPVVHSGRRPRPVRGITALAAAHTTRTPARTVVAAVSVAIGVAALIVVLGVRVAFDNSVVGTVLGNAVSIQVRGPDIVAVALIVILGLFAVADVVFLSLRDRATELATLRATGWTDNSLIRLIATEGILLGVTGAVLGVASGLAATWRLTHALPTDLQVLTVLTGIGAIAATVAVSLTVALAVHRQPTSALLAGE